MRPRSLVRAFWPAASNAPDDEGVAVEMTWNADEVGRLLDRRLADDPVRATILGTMRLALRTTSAGCWCAATPDGSAVAVRSDRRYPVVLDGVWPLSDFDEFAAVIDSLPELVGVNGAVSTAEAIAARLSGRVVGSKAIRLYRLDTLTAPADVPGEPRRVRQRRS